MKFASYKSSFRIASISAFVFMFCISCSIGIFISYQHDRHVEVTKELAKGQMEVISFITKEELQKGNYDSLTSLFKQWASQYIDIDEVKLISRNGFMIAAYGPLNPSVRRFILNREITYSYRGEVNLMLAYSLEGAYELTNELMYQMAVAGIFISAVFGLLIFQFASRRQEAVLLSNMVEELQDAESRNKCLAAYPKENPNPIVAYDMAGNEIFCNPAFTRLIGLLNTEDSSAVLPDDHKEILARMPLGEHQLYAEVDAGYKHLLLHYQWIGLVKEVYVYIQDITALRLAERALIDERNQARTTLSSIADAVITTERGGRIVYINESTERILKKDSDEIVGKRFEDVFELLDENRDTPINNPLIECQLSMSTAPFSKHAKLKLPDGLLLNVSVTATSISSEDKKSSGVVVVIRDVTKEKRLQEELYRQASHDNLTGLLNRSAFETHLEHALVSARKRDHEHILCFMDLDQFKVVNDTCGHVAGDELLRQIAAIMRRHFRGSDVLARVGGDEFGSILMDCPISMALRRIDTLRKEVYEYSFTWEDHSFRVSTSIGVVQIDRYSESTSTLMSSVDAACYTAKDAGRNYIHVYERDSATSMQLMGQMQWVSQINSALDEGRLLLYAQPIVDLHSADLTVQALEILVRMRSQENKIIPPGAFLPSAERYDLIDRIDSWVIEQTLLLLSKSDVECPDCFVNISGVTLNRNKFTPIMKTLFEKYSIDPRKLIFEITETAAIQNLSSALALMHELREIGCRFALDDFGSGLSSFGYLKNLPIDYLKIDGMFVKDIQINPMDRGMVEAIKTVADTMKLTTIAEFVEDRYILGEVQQIGIDLGQGYGIAKPKPIEEYLPGIGSQTNIIWLSH